MDAFRRNGLPRWLGACAGAFLGSIGCSEGATSNGAPTATAQAGSVVEITVIGTSDLHGRLATLPVLGGYLAALRAKAPDSVVLVDAGGMFQGTLESNLNEGQAVIDAYAALGYDGVAIGNHEFDYGPAGEASVVRKNAAGADADARGALKARAAQAQGKFPMLAANLLEDGAPLAWPNVVPSRIVTRKGIKIGIVGVTTMSTPSTTIAANVVGISVTPLAKAISREARSLRGQGAKVVVVAAHAGGECKSLDAPNDLSSCDKGAEIFEVANAIPEGEVDAIVAGHTHKAVAHIVHGIPIVQSRAYGEAFGRIDVSVDTATGEVVARRIHAPVRVIEGGEFAGTKTTREAGAESAVRGAITGAEARRKAPLGVTLEQPFSAAYKDESALGNWVTDLMLDLDPTADIALANGGGLRADLPKGPLTYGSLYDALPFDNRLARVRMKGSLVERLFEENLRSQSGILSVGGARVVARCKRGRIEVEVTLVDRDGKPSRKVRRDDEVKVITNEFLATHGDDFGPRDRVEIDEDGPAFRDPIAALLQKRGGSARPQDWLVPGKPRIALPGPIGPGVCRAKESK